MQPLHPFEDRPESSHAAVTDEEVRRETARRLAATQDEPQPCQSERTVMTTFSVAENRGGYQISTDSEANTALVPNCESNNVASNAEASPTDDTKTSRIKARVAELQVLLREEGDQFSPHIKGLEDLEEFEEAMKLLNLDEHLPDLSTGYPQTEDEFVAHCSVLFDAMKNLDNIHDVVGAAGGSGQSSLTRSGDSIAVKYVKSKKPIEINLVAGKLMRALRKAQRGRLSVPGQKFCKYNTFTARFQAVVDALMVSKLLVRSAFESDEWIDRIAVNPDAELHRKRTNKALNDAKNEKQKFAQRMKQQDPTISFKNTASSQQATASTSTAILSPVVQMQQQLQPSDQGSAVPSTQAQMGQDSSPLRPAKRVKTSQEQADQLETAANSSIHENKSSQCQQPMEGQAANQGRQVLQVPHDGSLDDGEDSFPGRKRSEKAAHRSMDERSEMEPGFASAGISQPSTTPSGGRGTAGRDGQVTYAQGVTLSLDPNPFTARGPIQQYRSDLYGTDDPRFHGWPPSSWAGIRVGGPGESHYEADHQQNQENQAEERD